MNITSATIRGAMLGALFAGGVSLSGVPERVRRLADQPGFAKSSAYARWPIPLQLSGRGRSGLQRLHW